MFLAPWFLVRPEGTRSWFFDDVRHQPFLPCLILTGEHHALPDLWMRLQRRLDLAQLDPEAAQL
ncbi:MAG TPA: hypothetical protein VFZ66_00480, partial [Herpetosiphonaceae bacterium]